MKETKLLTYPHGSTKTNKSMAYGYANFIMYLAPHKLSGHNVCPGATIGCIESCLNESGRGNWVEKNGKINPIHQARLNGTSDLRWENDWQNFNIIKYFSDIQFYDYTKLWNRRNLPANYHLTFSRAESNQEQTLSAIVNGLNISAVFRSELPKQYLGLNVINGDKHDLRFLDPLRSCVGLIAKGKAKHDTSGFVIN